MFVQIQAKGTSAYVPLRFERQAGEWVPLSAAPCAQAIDAARECHQHLLTKWAQLVHSCRVVRALCDHPDFNLDGGDKVDVLMVRQELSALVSCMESMSVDIEHLLQEASAEDRDIRLGG